jgi:hypothetical protein
MKNKLAFVLLAVAAISLVLFALSERNSDVDIASKFPSPAGNRVELPPEAGEEIRYVYFADDGVTKRMTQIEYRSGVTSFTTYRADGTKSETRAFYPLGAGEAKRQLRSLVTYADNGTSYKSHQVFREDGSLERNGGRLSNGGYQTLYFNAKDGSIQRTLVFDDNSKLEREDSFNDDGKLIEKTEKVSEYALKTTRYAADGTMLSEIVDETDGSRSGKFFYEDGVTSRMEFKVNAYSIEVNYFEKDGTAKYEVEYLTEGMAIIQFGADKKPAFKQYFAITGGKTLCDATFRLVKVEEFKGASGSYVYEVRRLIGIAPDGKTPYRVITFVNNAWSYERDDAELHADGSVKSIQHYNSSNQVDSTKTFAPGVEHIALPPAMFVQPTFECLDPPESKIKVQPQVEEQD